MADDEHAMNAPVPPAAAASPSSTFIPHEAGADEGTGTPLPPLTLLSHLPLLAARKPLTSLRSLATKPAGLATPSTVNAALGLHAALIDAALLHETTQALVAGGDARIVLAADGRNRYGCAARPDPTLGEFASSTASVVSSHGFEAARALTARLLADPARRAHETSSVRDELLALTGADAVAGTQLVLAASGTDLHLLAAGLAAGVTGELLAAVTVEASETGTGVLPALAFTHFGDATCRSEAVRAGASLDADGRAGAAVKTVRLRHADGTPRDPTVVDADFERHVDGVVQSGARCLLSLTDLTKTGLLAPSTACAMRLRERHGDRVVVLVDACQFRIAPSTLCAYLERNFMVAITGSKFVTGPAFCGALLLPAAFAADARAVPLGRLRAYSTRDAWPADWQHASALAPSHDSGMPTRWRAALAELRRFRAVPDGRIATHLEAFANAVSARLASDPAFDALAAPALTRSPHVAAWDDTPTLFSFVVHRPSAGGRRVPLTMAETAALQVQMRHAGELAAPHDNASRAIAQMRFQLGQPVACGMRDGEPVSALRLAASARMVADADASDEGVAPAIRQAMRAFDKLALLAGWPR